MVVVVGLRFWPSGVSIGFLAHALFGAGVGVQGPEACVHIRPSPIHIYMVAPVHNFAAMSVIMAVGEYISGCLWSSWCALTPGQSCWVRTRRCFVTCEREMNQV